MKKPWLTLAFKIGASLIALVLPPISSAVAQPGDFDPSFGGAGQVHTGFGGGPGEGRAMAVQPDGKIILAGFSQPNSTNSEFAVIRFDTNNMIDASFGVAGSVRTSIGPANNAVADAVQVQADGKIVAAGYDMNQLGYSEFALARYNSDGSLDASFGSGGVVVTVFDPFATESINAMLIQPDSKILVAGSYAESSSFGTSGFAFARYDTNGALDASFGTGGVVQTSLGGAIYALMLEGNGQIIAAGTDSENFAIARYDTNGVLDTNFGNGGITLTPVGVYYSFFGGYAAAHALATQLGNFTTQNPDKIVAVGQADINLGVSGFAVVRYNLDGSLDTSFGNGGIVTDVFSPGEYDQSYGESLLVQGSLLQARKITVGGYCSVNNTNYFALARLTAAGAFDTTFGSNSSGVVTLAVAPGGDDEAYAIRALGGQILLAGSSLAADDQYEFSAARFNSNGSLDPTFGDGGVMTAATDLPSRAQGLALQKDGKLIAAGVAASDFALVRYNSNGSVDSAFGTNGGTVTFPVGPNKAAASAVLLQPDGRILAAGFSSNGTNNNFAIIRCKTNGVLDPSFGNAGQVITSVGTSNAVAQAAAIQSDGKILVAGYGFSGGNEDFALARYKTNGALDSSFGSSGVILTGLGSGGAKASAVNLQTDGKILLAGQAQVGSATNFALLRYATNGVLDNSFGSFGRVTTDFGNGSSACGYAMALQPDGKILVTGGAALGGVEYVALARYNTNGTLDSSFGSGGEMITQVGSISDYANAIALQQNGRIIVAGASFQGANNAYAVLRYNSDGSLDTTFGTGGEVVIGITGNDDVASAVALDSTGRIVIAGVSANSFGLARLVGDPLAAIPIAISLPASKTLEISWPSSPSGWTLQQTSNLTSPAWVASSESVTNDGTNNILIAHPTGGHLFYRLINQ
jgi:uncharacterized delta-60 repeat protein